jgi:inner membrane protein
LLLSNQKGIRKIEKAALDGKELSFLPGKTNLLLTSNHLNRGIHTALQGFTNAESNFDISIAMQGGQSLRFFPAGQDTHVEVSADWSSPSFQGSFLPGSSNIADSGFSAVWDISYLSRDIPLFWKTANNSNNTPYIYENYLFGVDFFRAIDTYALNTRAVKYAILFLIVPFLTLFLLEVFAKKRIHPVPYLLSGIANIIFYLLLLSLSEQMHFYIAYIIAAIAVVSLLTIYSRALMPSWGKSWYMGLVVSTSYILLYAVLNAESYALLIGSIVAFVAVALLMYLTRKLDWYDNTP